MPAYHISGPSGAGKSTVGRALQDHGFKVIDTDTVPGLSGWFETDSGLPVAATTEMPRSIDWLQSHRWLWRQDQMRKLLADAEADPVFFCGGANNQKDFYPAFSRRFGLAVANDMLTKRLQAREPERWLDNSPELNRMLSWNNKLQATAADYDVTLLDGIQPTACVIRTIVEHVGLTPRSQPLLSQV